jgi:hypothetical protein
MTDKSKDVANKVKENLSNYRRQFEQNWKREERVYYGDIWEGNQYKPFENTVFQIIEGEVPVLTDALTTTVARADDPEFEIQGQVLSKAMEWVYEDQKLPVMLPMVVRNSLMSGPGWIYTYYDANACNGDGQIKYEVLRWDQVYLDGKRSLIEDADSARIELERSRDWLMLNYPKHKKDLKDSKSTVKDEASSTSNRSEKHDVGGKYKRQKPLQYKDEDTLRLDITIKKDFSMEKIPEDVTLEELQEEAKALAEGEAPDLNKWQDHEAHNERHFQERAELLEPLNLMPQASMEEIEAAIDMILEQNPDANLDQLLLQVKILDDHMEGHKVLAEENPNGERLKYPNGWRVIEQVSKTVLYDGEMKEEHGEIPLVPFYCYKDKTIYGFSEVRNLVDSQNMAAVMEYKEYKGLQKVANPGIIYDKETGLTDDDITNEDGALYQIPQGTRLEHMNPGAISPQVTSFSQNRKQVMRDISGVGEATEGKIPSPTASGTTVERLQQQSIGRIRLKQRNNDYYSMARLGRITLGLIIQYWSLDKILKIGNDIEGVEQIIIDPMSIFDAKYEITAAPGSLAGIDKESFNASLKQDVANGFITYEQYLEIAEIPKKQKLKEFASQNNQQAAQQQEMQAQLEQMQVDFQAQMEQMAQENAALKGTLNQLVNPAPPPELVNNEEKQIFEQQQRDDQISQLAGVNSDQPVQI